MAAAGRAPSGAGERAAVVGGGLGGLLTALNLARAGYRVEVYERHGDPRRERVAGPSMNLGLSRRGLTALAAVGLDRRMLDRAIPMTGRVVHRLDGGLDRQPYGLRAGEVIHAIKRLDINRCLLDALDAAGVAVHFHHLLVDLDKESGALDFEDPRDGARSRAQPDFTVGADGAFSTVRRRLQRDERADFSQEFLDWGWKELSIPPLTPDAPISANGGRPALAGNAFHLWPRGGSMVFAHPNLDGSFTCSFVLPYEGPRSFASLATDDEVRALFRREFPDLLALIPDLVEQFRANPVVSLVSVRTSPWVYGDRFVLLGDSAHAVVPFYAQGMNCAFEDAGELVARLGPPGPPGDHRGDRSRRQAAFAAFERARRPHTDALAAMSKANFLELRDRVRSPWLRARRRIDAVLGRALGGAWMPLHARVTNTCVPYADAVRMDRRQDRILIGAGVLLAAAVAAAVWGGLFRR